jgi:hypothetical protein
MSVYYHIPDCALRFNKNTHEVTGVKFPNYSYALSMSDINRKIAETRARIQQFSPTGSSRNIDGGKRFRARQIAKKDQAYQKEAANEKLNWLLAAKEKIQNYKANEKLKLLEAEQLKRLKAAEAAKDNSYWFLDKGYL